MGKKEPIIEPAVKLGGGSFSVAFVKSFTKQRFVNDARLRELVSFTQDIDDYLSKIWEDCHKDEQLKASATVTEFDPETGEPITPVIEPVKKTATKRNSEQPRK